MHNSSSQRSPCSGAALFLHFVLRCFSTDSESMIRKFQFQQAQTASRGGGIDIN